MESQETKLLVEQSDILSMLESENITHDDASDPLATLLKEESVIFEEKPKESALMRFHRSITPKIKFSLYYLGISTIVFIILLSATNWNSYSTLLSAYLNPDDLKTSGNDIVSMLGKSKIMVYADNTESTEAKQDQEDQLKQKLKESNSIIREDRFSPKTLIPAATKMDIDFDITPYDNRIIIPKIGKNIPLVDIGVNSGFDFDHIENIFMKELEKWIVRYPGTARPGEKGNAFIFGHSSNYPWMKWEYNSVFVLLDELTFGDEIIVYYNQKKFVYVIQEKKVIKPGNVKVLDRDPEKTEISLMTCWPIWTTINRLIVFAELQE